MGAVGPPPATRARKNPAFNLDNGVPPDMSLVSITAIHPFEEMGLHVVLHQNPRWKRTRGTMLVAKAFFGTFFVALEPALTPKSLSQASSREEAGGSHGFLFFSHAPNIEGWD